MNSDKKALLIIAHTPSPNTIAMANEIYAGSTAQDIEFVDVILCSPFDCTSEMILSSDALLIFTTENFGYMSGALKDLFDRVYYACLADPKRNDATPFLLIIKAGLDGTGTDVAVNKITNGLNWKAIRATTIFKGEFEPSFLDRCKELGLTIAASLDADII